MGILCENFLHCIQHFCMLYTKQVNACTYSLPTIWTDICVQLPVCLNDVNRMDHNTIPVGPQVSASRDPLEMFSHFFVDDILSLIVRETNRFAAQCLVAANTTTTTWETNLEEIRAYLGFMVVMGVNRLPEIRDYWSVDSKLNNTFISSRVTRKCFEEITRYLHFVDNSRLPFRDEPGFHRLQKVMPIITAMKEKFEGNYNPHPQNSIDEAMIPFKGTCTCTCICTHTLYIFLDIVWYVYIHTHLLVPSHSLVPRLSLLARNKCMHDL